MSTTIRMFDGDVFLNSAGRGEELTGADKAAQDLAEILMTPFDSDRDYGSELADLDIPQPVSALVGKSLITRKVDEAVQRLIRFQQADPYATAQERIEKLHKIVVEQFETSSFLFWVNVLLEDQTILGDRVLAVSLRHQESASLVDTVQELARKLSTSGA